MGLLCLYFSASKISEMLRLRSIKPLVLVLLTVITDIAINEMEMVLSARSQYITSTGMELTDAFNNRSFQ